MRHRFALLATCLATLAVAPGCGITPEDVEPENRLIAVDPEHVAIVVIDAQPFFWNWMAGDRGPVEARMEQLLLLSSLTEIPLMATFEKPTASNGWLPERLEKVFPEHGQRYEKSTFNCCGEQEIRAAVEELKASGVTQVALAGAETDVCVLQSAFGLQDMGLDVFLLEDCLFTNEPNAAPAIRRMYDGGVIPCTYKTFFFEVMRSVDRSSYPKEWRERRSKLPAPLRSPYELPAFKGHVRAEKKE